MGDDSGLATNGLSRGTTIAGDLYLIRLIGLESRLIMSREELLFLILLLNRIHNLLSHSYCVLRARQITTVLRSMGKKCF